MERVLRLTAFWLMAAVSGFVVLFAAGEAMTDPGGWGGVALIALWAVPLTLLCALAWWWPEPAVRVLAVLTGVVVGLDIWFAVVPGAWRAFEDHHGPVRDLVFWVVAAAAAVVGRKRARAAGVLLLVAGLTPIVIDGSSAGGSITMLATPTVIVGVLYLLSAALATPPLAGDGVSPPEQARSGR